LVIIIDAPIAPTYIVVSFERGQNLAGGNVVLLGLVAVLIAFSDMGPDGFPALGVGLYLVHFTALADLAGTASGAPAQSFAGVRADASAGARWCFLTGPG
jgi:hypothetical protein